MAKVTTRYEPSKTGWDAIALSPDLLAACMSEARKGKAFAEGIAPRSGDDEGKPYADSFDVEPTVVTLGRGPRVAARLTNHAPHAAAVEFGNKRTPKPHRVLGRTAAFLGNA